MQFILKIDLGNDAMQTPEDIALALLKVVAKLDVMQAFDGDSCPIMDANGHQVGNWRHDEPEPKVVGA